MTALAVREHFDILKYCCLGVLVRLKVLQMHQCRLSGVKEALRHGVVPVVALAAHTRLYPVLGAELPLAVGVLLTATLGMHDQPRCRLALAERHGQRLVHKVRPHVVGHCLPNHRPRAQLQHKSEKQPAFACRKVRHVPHVHRSWLGHTTDL
jgi:hypothetical protein